MESKDIYKLILSKEELIALYVVLKSNEKDNKQPIINVLKKIEKNIYDILTIEEIENIEQLYSSLK